MVDSSDDTRLKECFEELNQLLNEAKLAKVPLLVYANKQDLEFAVGAEEVVNALSLSDITDRVWSIYACSAIEGVG